MDNRVNRVNRVNTFNSVNRVSRDNRDPLLFVFEKCKLFVRLTTS